MNDRGLTCSSGLAFKPLPPPPPLALLDGVDGTRDSGRRDVGAVWRESMGAESDGDGEANRLAGVRLTTDEGEKGKEEPRGAGDGVAGGSRDRRPLTPEDDEERAAAEVERSMLSDWDGASAAALSASASSFSSNEV